MTQLFKVCGASPVNNHILFLNGRDIHFDKSALRQINCRNIQTFVMNSVNSINYQPYYNGPNSKLKSLYNVEKAVWMLNYGTTKFLPRHMKYVLVESWDAFKISAGNIIRDIFSKTNLPPLVSPGLTTNTQAYAASIQVSSESKAQINQQYISHTVAPI